MPFVLNQPSKVTMCFIDEYYSPFLAIFVQEIEICNANYYQELKSSASCCKQSDTRAPSNYHAVTKFSVLRECQLGRQYTESPLHMWEGLRSSLPHHSCMATTPSNLFTLLVCRAKHRDPLECCRKEKCEGVDEPTASSLTVKTVAAFAHAIMFGEFQHFIPKPCLNCIANVHPIILFVIYLYLQNTADKKSKQGEHT